MRPLRVWTVDQTEHEAGQDFFESWYGWFEFSCCYLSLFTAVVAYAGITRREQSAITAAGPYTRRGHVLVGRSCLVQTIDLVSRAASHATIHDSLRCLSLSPYKHDILNVFPVTSTTNSTSSTRVFLHSYTPISSLCNYPFCFFGEYHKNIY